MEKSNSNVTPRNVKILYTRDFFAALRFFAAIQIIYFAHIAGSYALAMSVFSVATISQAFLEIPTGVFSDKVGRRITTIVATFSGFISVMFYAVGINYWFLLVGAVIEGMARALGSGNNDALVYDSLKELGREKEYSKFIGREGSIWQIGFGVAAFIGGFIATSSLALAMWLSVLTQLISFIATLFLREPTTISKSELNPYAHLKEAVRAFRSNKKLRLLLSASVLKESLSESAHQFAPSFINQLWPLWAIGIMSMATDFLSALGFYFSDKILRRLTLLKTLVSTFVIDRVINLVAYIFPTVFSPMLMGSTALTYGVSQVATNTLSQEEFTDHQRATMGSLSSIVMSLGFAVASVVVGYAADKIGPRNILLLLEILLVPVLLVYWKLFKHTK